jgi:hypothetical protein
MGNTIVLAAPLRVVHGNNMTTRRHQGGSGACEILRGKGINRIEHLNFLRWGDSLAARTFMRGGSLVANCVSGF